MRDFVRVEATQSDDADQQAARDTQAEAQGQGQDQLPLVRLEIGENVHLILIFGSDPN